MGTTPAAPVTYWENIAKSRWGTYVTRHERRILDDALEQLDPGLALEVGCDGGRWSRHLTERGWSIVCTDIDPATLAVCRERLPDARCVLVSPEDETLPVESGSTRLVLVYEVYRVIESDWFLGEAFRVLEPGGMLVCSSWNPRSARGIFYRLVARTDNRARKGRRRLYDYYRGPSYRAFRKRLQAAGFEITREVGICWFPFRRDSDSPLVEPATAIESAVGLTRLPTLSPWVLTIGVRGNGSPVPAR